VADLLYTTGTTGQAKAVLVSHDAIVADAENLVEAQHYDADLTFIINGPLNHIGSLSKIYPVVYTGGTLQLADGMKDLNRFFAMVDDAGSKVATFLVPASIRMLLTFAKDKLASYAHKIDFIETGAAPMPQEDMQRLCRVLPQTRLYNTYASTETGIISTYDYNDGECIAGCLGKPMRHSAFFITEDGTVACCGKTLMTGYWNDAEATAKVLQGDAVVTADLGTIDGQGRLRLQGRSDDVINVGGYKIAPTEIESVALSFPGVKDCVCIDSPHPVMGKVLALLVVPDDGYNRRDLIACLKANLEPHKLPMLYREITEVRRTFNGKIDRKSYR
jgi:long-chain acyl-CoA synthetase